MPSVVDNTTYKADGQTERVSYPHGVSTLFGYNADRGWVNRITTSNAGGELLDLNYARDTVGRISTVRSNRQGEDWDYSYDTLDRLILADNQNDNTLDQSFEYRPNGNMHRNSRFGGTYSYPAFNAPRPHAPTALGSRTYSYDANGNATSDGTRTFGWDGATGFPR